MATEQDVADCDLTEHTRQNGGRGGLEDASLGGTKDSMCDSGNYDSEIEENSNVLRPDFTEDEELPSAETVQKEFTETEETENGAQRDEDNANKEDGVTEGDKDHEEKDDDENVEDEETEEEEEEEEPETEMTEEEKEEMYTAVCSGDVAVFQNCLDKPNGDMNMTWFNENLLMVAMRTGQTMMAEFLIDVGIDVNYDIDLIDLHEKEKTGAKRFDCYRKSCRQIAYETGQDMIVELIDLRNDNWFPYSKKTPRCTYSRRPLPPPLPPTPGQVEEEEEEEEEEEDDVKDNKRGKKEEESKRKQSKKDDDTDSGHHSGKFDEIKDVDDNSSFLSGDMMKRNDFELNDDGYWSFTQPSSPYNCVPEKPERPGLLSRGTKASFLLRKHTNQILENRKYSKSAKERTVTVVEAVGSYAKESRRWKRKSVDQESVESIPFLARLQSAKTTCSEPVRTQSHYNYSRRQRPLTTQSTFSQVSKILGESRLLRSSPREPPLPYINTTQHRQPLKRTTKVTPWCHSNSTGVLHKLSDIKIQNKIADTNFHVERQLCTRNRKSHSRIS